MKPVLLFALSHKKMVISISLILFIAAAAFASQLPFNLLPTAKSGQVAVKVELPEGSPLSDVDAEVKKAEIFETIQMSLHTQQILVPTLHPRQMMYLIKAVDLFNKRM